MALVLARHDLAELDRRELDVADDRQHVGSDADPASETNAATNNTARIAAP